MVPCPTDNDDDSGHYIDDDDDSGDYDVIDDDDSIHDSDSDDVVGMRNRLVLMTIYAMLRLSGTHIIFAWYLTNNENNVLWEFSIW